jgi:hypothetical protein
MPRSLERTLEPVGKKTPGKAYRQVDGPSLIATATGSRTGGRSGLGSPEKKRPENTGQPHRTDQHESKVRKKEILEETAVPIQWQ